MKPKVEVPKYKNIDGIYTVTVNNVIITIKKSHNNKGNKKIVWDVYISSWSNWEEWNTFYYLTDAKVEAVEKVLGVWDQRDHCRESGMVFNV